MRRSKFALSHAVNVTMDMGKLVPIGLTEVLPGDAVQQKTTALVRCSPLLAPVMHAVDCRIHHWFVPNRLVWSDWEDFITGGLDGNDASTFPTITLTPSAGSLADYLGVPLGTSIAVNALPFRGYALIWNEFYADQDLDTALTIDLTDGADSTTNTTLKNINWEKDRFTSARPWEQKGPTISLPLGTEAPVTGIGRSSNSYSTGTMNVYETGGSGTVDYTAGWANPDTGAANSVIIEEDQDNAGFPNIKADLSAATSASVNLIREAFALQRFEEARARYGARYSEYLRYLGVRSSDARLQRPEYLGGGRNTIQFSEVLSSNGATGGNLGQLGGHGINATRSNRYRRFFEEHGFIHSFMSIRPKTMYSQGVPKHFIRSAKEDFWQKELETIGQEEIQNREVYVAHSDPTGTFGYQDRYDEYRRSENRVAGDFHSTLDEWHFARTFSSDPSLNASFVNCVPSEEPFAASSNHTMWLQIQHSIQARRLLSKVGRSYTF